MRAQEYHSPNELYPQDANSILKRAPEGAYVGVGTERAILGFIQARSSTHLIWIDPYPSVLAFNEFNLELLKAARSREDYLHLRLEADVEEVRSRLYQAPGRVIQVVSDILELMRSPDFGEGHFNQNYEYRFRSKPFRTINYLFNDEAFARIKQAVDEGRVFIKPTDLSNKNSLESLRDFLVRNALKISVLDISNIANFNEGFNAYMKIEKALQMLKVLKSVAHRLGFILHSYTSNSMILKDIFRPLPSISWKYYAWSFDFSIWVYESDMRSVFFDQFRRGLIRLPFSSKSGPSGCQLAFSS